MIDFAARVCVRRALLAVLGTTTIACTLVACSDDVTVNEPPAPGGAGGVGGGGSGGTGGGDAGKEADAAFDPDAPADGPEASADGATTDAALDGDATLDAGDHDGEAGS